MMIRSFVVQLAMWVAACGGGRSPAPRLANEVAQPDPSALARRADEALAATLKPDYQRPLVKKPDVLAPVRARYLDACEAGDRRSCWLADAIRRSDRAAAMVRRNCLAGDQMSCRALPWNSDLRPSKQFRGWAGRWSRCYRPECQEDLRQECAEGFAASCWRISNPSDDERARAASLAREGCREGILEECRGLFQLPGRDRPSSELEFAAGQFCRLTAICERAVSLYEHEPIKQRDALERTCQYGPKVDNIIACDTLADGYRDRLYPEPVPGRGRALAEWRCLSMHSGPGSLCMQEVDQQFPAAVTP